MNSSVHTREKAASPWMVGASVLMHGLFILALIAVSTTVAKRTEPPIPNTVIVKPVAPPGPPSPMTIAPKPREETPAVSLESSERAAPPEKAEPKKRPTVTPKKADLKPPEQIPVVRRKRAAQTVAELPKKEPKKQPPKKQEDPQEYLTNRLKALQDKVNRERPGPPPAPRPGPPGPTDEQFARWYGGMRDKINAHWSVFQENRAVDRKTVVGVQIADDGTLLNARVDESSGDPVFDRSAMRAVHQAAPFPPVPPRIREKIRQAGGLALSFEPGGIQ